ncbi:double-strand break repair helicase AddA [Kordiimonas marina]|uniref:double-strand break repair helicase AddA n=1 Tax=Kordiimonas marina TaxID=2872312 RepID=UPI001FF54CCA|nr:double-strand break repair helicase AddA [Kordiimonas marina]MCJ9428316.1 double-strand break repair helicase AddA [Kordiimonas marina]
MSTRMTYEQARATDPMLTAWVGASAGTGKTHVLTARVLRLMLTGTPPENILCLTFTKAAAAEMKTRIFAELGRWSLMSDDVLAEEISRRTEEYADEAMLSRARQLFAAVLDLSGGLQIQTFHSFCQALLGRFPLEAGMAPGFEGMDEAEAREAMASARDQMLSATRAKGAGDLSGALDTVAGLVTENTFDEVVASLSFEAATLDKAERTYGGLLGMTAALYRALDLTPGEQAEDLIRAAVPDAAFDAAGVRALMTGLLAGTVAEAKMGQALADFLAAEDGKRPDLFADYAGVFLTQKDEPRARVANKKTLEAGTGLDEVIEKEQARLMRLMDRLKRLKVATATTALMTLGVEQLSRYRHMKAERGLVDFDDMIDRTVKLLDRAEVAPWVLFKLDSAIDHILVDEAQDTNAMQWQVVETLAAEFFSGEGARDVVRTLFAVGDAKQSIFSFQRADPREFVAARDRVFARAFEADYEAETVPLNLSFRSGGAVLGLVDAVFHAEAAASIGLSADDEAVEHRYIREGHGGLVELWPLEEPTPEADDAAEDEGWVPPTRQESAHDAEQRTAWRIARRIRAMLDEGEILESKGRPIRAGDILVLVRRRTAFVDHLVRALKATGIPVAGRDRMVLTDELPVMDLLALAHFALLPTDDLTLATVLKSPFVGLDDDALFRLAHGRKGTLWQALYAKRNETPEYKAAYRDLVDIMNAADRRTPFEFLSHVLTELGGRMKLSARLGAEIHDPVDELLEEALRFELTTSASLQAFVQRVEGGGTQIKRDMEAAGGMVRIMTAHSAKGLQAPIVFLSDLVGLPDIGRDARVLPLPSAIPGQPSLLIWTSQGKDLAFIEEMKGALKAKQLAEYRRLLYVALTRAEDRLYVAGWQGAGEPDEHSWFGAITDGFDRIGAESLELTPGYSVRRFTVPQTAEVTPEKTTEAAPTRAAAPAWLYNPLPEEPLPPRPLAPSRPDDEDPAATSPLTLTKRGRFFRGRVIHALLEWLPDMAPENREAAAMAYLGRLPEVPGGESASLWAEVKAILNHADFSALFAPGSRAEVPVAGIVGTRVISGQVDRLVVTEGEVLIVDYKTNRPPPDDVAAVAAAYVKQMALYARALEAVYPGRTVRALLLWTDAARLMEIPKTLMDEALSQMGL